MNLRKNVAAIIEDERGLILAGERSDIAGSWQLPQGGIDSGETAEEALFREIKEETGIDRKFLRILARSNEIFYLFPPSIKRRFEKYDGQNQIYFHLKIADSGWKLQKTDEFASFQWITKEEALKRIVAFKKRSYLEAFKQIFGEKNAN